MIFKFRKYNKKIYNTFMSVKFFCSSSETLNNVDFQQVLKEGKSIFKKCDYMYNNSNYFSKFFQLNIMKYCIYESTLFTVFFRDFFLFGNELKLEQINKKTNFLIKHFKNIEGNFFNFSITVQEGYLSLFFQYNDKLVINVFKLGSNVELVFKKEINSVLMRSNPLCFLEKDKLFTDKKDNVEFIDLLFVDQNNCLNILKYDIKKKKFEHIKSLNQKISVYKGDVSLSASIKSFSLDGENFLLSVANDTLTVYQVFKDGKINSQDFLINTNSDFLNEKVNLGNYIFKENDSFKFFIPFNNSLKVLEFRKKNEEELKKDNNEKFCINYIQDIDFEQNISNIIIKQKKLNDKFAYSFFYHNNNEELKNIIYDGQDLFKYSYKFNNKKIKKSINYIGEDVLLFFDGFSVTLNVFDNIATINHSSIRMKSSDDVFFLDNHLFVINKNQIKSYEISE